MGFVVLNKLKKTKMKSTEKPIVQMNELTLMENKAMITSTARKYLGQKHADWVDDIVQEVMFKAISKSDQFDDSKGNIGAWLYTITKRMCLDFISKKRELTGTEYTVSYVNSFVQNQFDEDNSSVKASVRSALSCLSGRERSVLIMRYYFECSGREIAAYLSVPEKNVPMLIKRAKERMSVLVDKSHAA